MQYLIDASVYVFRAYYSMPDDMVDGDGNPINALYGFCRFLGDFIEQVFNILCANRVQHVTNITFCMGYKRHGLYK